METKKLNLAQKIVEIRKQVEYLKKDASGYNYKYVSGTQIISKIRPKMDELGVLVTPIVINAITDKCTDETKSGKGRDMFITTIHSCVVWMDADSGEKLEVPSYGIAKQDDPARAYGSAFTYMMRYHYLHMLAVPTDELDPDAFTAKAHPELAKIGAEQKKQLIAVMEKSAIDAADAKKIIAKYGYAKASDIKMVDFDEIMKSFKSYKPKTKTEKKG